MEVEIKEVVKHYGKREVLSIDYMTFTKGKAYGVIGPNGAGKTTLFKCITNIITDYTGEVLIDGQSVKENNDILSHVGIVLDGTSVYKDRTGWFNIEYFSGLRGNFDSEKAELLARELEISEYLNGKVKYYSYGMIKKLILLIALLHDPKILILDEPFRGLDSDSVKWFKFYLKQMTVKGMILIISSHVKSDIESLCDDVFVLMKGHLEKEISLTDMKDKLVRDIETTNQTGFIAILEMINYYYQILDNGYVRLNIKDDRWSDVKRQLDSQKIEILEMKKENILESHLNKGEE
ncbi:ABC transporter ATP-binding protein [Vagococcus jeotgali]|uniref:ABC transporter ATP-binding protein n=1 Tax=Vagococcus jeotgali TaxID=3109030 RepID=UPI002DDB270F|nr:ABC transporter ATP-binding protein [Vagococcus sp. B2T-5]